MSKKNNRFNLELDLEPIGTVVAGRGQKYEHEFEVPPPVGRVWATKALDIIAALESLRTVQLNQNGDETANNMLMLDAISKLIGNDRFYNDLLPSVLGVFGDEQATTYLSLFFTPMEIFTAFSEAAALISARAFGSEETQTAIKKSEEDGVETLDR